MSKYFLTIASVLLLTGCLNGPTTSRSPTSSSPAGKPVSTRDIELLEAVFRNRLKDADFDGTIFLSSGPVDGKWKDPANGLIQRLGDLKVRLKPVSQARMPKPGEMESPDRFRGVEDPSTGKRSPVYWVKVNEWLSPTIVRVDFGMWEGPLSGGGGTCTYELRDGKWILGEMEDGWAS